MRIWTAVAVVLMAASLAGSADALVREMGVDQEDGTYSSAESVVFSGKIDQVGGLIKMKIVDPSGGMMDCTASAVCGDTTANRTEFKFEPILVSSVFKTSGTYEFHVRGLSDKDEEAFVALMSYDGTTAKYLGSRLVIKDISDKAVNAGEAIMFTADVTDDFHKDVKYSLKAPFPPGANMASSGKFTWTPSDSEVRSKAHTLTVVAAGSGQTAEKEFKVTVNDRAPLVKKGVVSLTADRDSYNRAESITLSGTVSETKNNEQVRVIVSTTGENAFPVHSVRVTPSGKTFQVPPLGILEFFGSEGRYKITAFVPEQVANPYTVYAEKKGTTLKFLGPQLTLRELATQYATVGSSVSFKVWPTDASFTSLDYELKNPLGTARIDNDGIFKWTPTASHLGTNGAPMNHTVSIMANSKTDKDVTATLDVIIEVRPVPASTPGAAGGESDPAPVDSGAKTEAPKADSRVETLVTDAGSYDNDESIIFSGTTSNASRSDIITVTISPPSGKTTPYSGLPSNDNTFKLTPIQVRDAFSRAGVYNVTAFTSTQGVSEGVKMQMEYENRRASVIFETPLEIASIPRQSVETGSTLSFTAKPTESSFKDLTWSLGGYKLDGATISGDGKFSWSPPASALRGTTTESFTISIEVTDGLQSASRDVTIDLKAPAPEPESKPDPKPEPTPDPKPESKPEPAREPEPPKADPLEAVRQQFLSTVKTADKESLVERYETDPTYKTWFDTNFEGLDIREALGTEPPAAAPSGPDPKFAAYMPSGDDPKTYIDRYNTDPAYKAWFDTNFPDLTIQQATGYADPAAAKPPASEPKKNPDPSFAPYMTAGDDPKTYFNRYLTEPAYAAWFDANFPDLTIEDATGYDPTASKPATPTPAPVPTPAPEPAKPDPSFVQYMTQGDDPKTYVDRYNTDPSYKAWFDANFPDLTIQKAAGYSPSATAAPAPAPTPAPAPKPHPDFVPYMSQGDDPKTYVDRYNTDSAYKAWFDSVFPNLTIEQAAGYSKQAVPACPPGSALKDGKCAAVSSSPVPGAGGCLIATAAHGTELAPQIQQLREVRDSVLLSTASGASFMSAFNEAYYSFSPAVADMERQSPEFRALVRALITPMVSSLSIMSLAEPGSESGVAALGAAVIALNVGMYVAAPSAAAVVIRSRLRRR